jgi:VIT1/CCC1 family predicted Fe2+/Mn2+ transporter
MNKVDWQRWAMAVWYDLVSKEDKQQLTRVEKIYYNLYAAIAFTTVGAAVGATSYFAITSTIGGLIVSIICLGVATRKLQIFFHKKKQWEKEQKDYTTYK